MTKRTISLSIIFFLFAGAALAQDPLKIAPQAYKLEFENEWVKVVRVHYGPHERFLPTITRSVRRLTFT
jgi:hypothetical protein